MFQLISNLIKVVMFFAGLWSERDKDKATAKIEIANRITDAFRQTNKDKQASRLNSAIDSINKLR